MLSILILHIVVAAFYEHPQYFVPKSYADKLGFAHLNSWLSWAPH